MLCGLVLFHAHAGIIRLLLTFGKLAFLRDDAFQLGEAQWVLTSWARLVALKAIQELSWAINLCEGKADVEWHLRNLAVVEPAAFLQLGWKLRARMKGVVEGLLEPLVATRILLLVGVGAGWHGAHASTWDCEIKVELGAELTDLARGWAGSITACWAPIGHHNGERSALVEATEIGIFTSGML